MTDSSQKSQIEILNCRKVGKNEMYEFCVGQVVGGRWIAFANSDHGLFIFHEASDEDFCLGCVEEKTAILKCGAVAQDPLSGYGGMDEWFVGEELRGDPKDYRCNGCDALFCNGDCYGECYDGLDPWDEEHDI